MPARDPDPSSAPDARDRTSGTAAVAGAALLSGSVFAGLACLFSAYLLSQDWGGGSDTTSTLETTALYVGAVAIPAAGTLARSRLRGSDEWSSAAAVALGSIAVVLGVFVLGVR